MIASQKEAPVTPQSKEPEPSSSEETNAMELEDNEESEDTLGVVVEEHFEMAFNWRHTLGHCTDDILEKMLQNTTQYFPNWIEVENQSYTVQHYQKRLFPLHYRQLPGRN
eukprot:14486-Ditylum_brightwellii.AAC.1